MAKQQPRPAARQERPRAMPPQQKALQGVDKPAAGQRASSSEDVRNDAGEPGMRVRATKLGYYDDKRRRVGDVFTIRTAKNSKGAIAEFSEKWMEPVDPSTPERITTGQQQLSREHDEVLAARAGGAPAAGTGDANVIGDDD